MQAYRVETTIEPDGSLTVCNLPFLSGEKVEVIVLPSPSPQVQAMNDDDFHPLQHLPVAYLQDPFAPAAPEEDWEALR